MGAAMATQVARLVQAQGAQLTFTRPSDGSTRQEWAVALDMSKAYSAKDMPEAGSNAAAMNEHAFRLRGAADVKVNDTFNWDGMRWAVARAVVNVRARVMRVTAGMEGAQ